MSTKSSGTVLLSKELSFAPSPLGSLTPFKFQAPLVLSMGEAISYQGKIYAFLGDPELQDHWILWDCSLEEVFRKLIQIFDWNHCLHPLDLINWEEVFSFFHLGTIVEAGIFDLKEESLEALRGQTKKLSTQDFELLKRGRLDWKSWSLSQKRGVRLDCFSRWCLEHFALSFQNQLQLIESFYKYFRRTRETPEQFLLRHQSYLEEIDGSNREFLIFVLKHTSPLLYQERLKREKRLKSLGLPQIIQAEFDRSLERCGIDLRIHLEASEDLDSLRRVFNDPQIQENLRDFLGEE